MDERDWRSMTEKKKKKRGKGERWRVVKGVHSQIGRKKEEDVGMTRVVFQFEYYPHSTDFHSLSLSASVQLGVSACHTHDSPSLHCSLPPFPSLVECLTLIVIPSLPQWNNWEWNVLYSTGVRTKMGTTEVIVRLLLPFRLWTWKENTLWLYSHL